MSSLAENRAEPAGRKWNGAWSVRGRKRWSRSETRSGNRAGIRAMRVTKIGLRVELVFRSSIFAHMLCRRWHSMFVYVAAEIDIQRWMSAKFNMSTVYLLPWLALSSVSLPLRLLCPYVLRPRSKPGWGPKYAVFTALHVMQTRYCDENSVCPSVCPSVCHTRVLWQNG